MKEIIINGREYYYESYGDYDSDFTRFYKKSGTKKRFIFFGKLVNNYEFVFSTSGWIDYMSKEKKKLINGLELMHYFLNIKD